MQLSYTLGSHSPLHSREAARFMEALYEDRGEPSAPLRRYALESGFDPDGDWGAVLIGSSEDVAPAKLRAIAWRARVGLQAGFGTVRFMEEAGLTTLLLQHRHSAVDLLDAARGSLRTRRNCPSSSRNPRASVNCRWRFSSPAVTWDSPGCTRRPWPISPALCRDCPARGWWQCAGGCWLPWSSDGGSSLRETLTPTCATAGTPRRSARSSSSIATRSATGCGKSRSC